MKRLPWSFLVLVAAFGASVAGCLLALTPPTPMANADINNATHLSLHHIARNLVLGEAIDICSPDYPNATVWAMALWNDALHGEGYMAPSTNAFRTGCPSPTGAFGNRIAFVSVEAKLPSDPEFFCPISSNACLLVPLVLANHSTLTPDIYE